MAVVARSGAGQSFSLVHNSDNRYIVIEISLVRLKETKAFKKILLKTTEVPIGSCRYHAVTFLINGPVTVSTETTEIVCLIVSSVLFNLIWSHH